MKYRHTDAYCLVTYATAGGEREVLWNSRDGRSPQWIVSRNTGERAQRNEIGKRLPRYVPEIGSRVIVDMTEQRARILAAESVERFEREGPPESLPLGFPSVPIQELFATRADAVKSLAEFNWHRGAPDILVVTAGYVEQLEAARKAAGDPADPGPQLRERTPDSFAFDRQGKPITMERYIELHTDPEYLIVARTSVGEHFVSTVWLGIDHGFSFIRGAPPIIFETMVFRKRASNAARSKLEAELDLPADDPFYDHEAGPEQERYATEREAIEGHRLMVAMVRLEVSAKEGSS